MAAYLAGPYLTDDSNSILYLILVSVVPYGSALGAIIALVLAWRTRRPQFLVEAVVGLAVLIYYFRTAEFL